MEYSSGTVVFGNWRIIRKLGEGSSGQVFEIHNEVHGVILKSALKVIRIPHSENEVRQLFSEGMNEELASSYFMQAIEDLEREVCIMMELKGNDHIVRCEDYQFIENPDGMGGDILIRMELLTSLQDYLFDHTMNETEVCRMATELCSALEYCHSRGMIHRDIKPENIFITEQGQFKLGDFGLARTVEKSSGGLSKKGTDSYMAPEIYLGKKYDNSIDLYSLGLVLYRIMNRNRLPFFPVEGMFSYSDREEALLKRMSGEKLPDPADADGNMSRIILKACAFQPEDRFHTACEMRQAFDNNTYTERKTQSHPIRTKRILPVISGIIAIIGLAVIGAGFYFKKKLDTGSENKPVVNNTVLRTETKEETETTEEVYTEPYEETESIQEAHTEPHKETAFVQETEPGKETELRVSNYPKLDAVPVEKISTLKSAVYGGEWNTTNKIQGVEWNTDTLDTVYFSFSKYLVASSMDGTKQISRENEGYCCDLEYYDGKILMTERKYNCEFRINVYDASNLSLIQSVLLPDVNELLDEDSQKSSSDSVTACIDGITIAPGSGSESGLKVYVSYGVWDDASEQKLCLRDTQIILEYDYEDITNSEQAYAKRKLNVDIGPIKYGIQSLEYDRDTGNIWCAVRKADQYSLFCLNKDSIGNTVDLVPNGNRMGWECDEAGDGICSLGNDTFYVLIPEYKESTTSGTALKVSLDNLENVVKDGYSNQIELSNYLGQTATDIEQEFGKPNDTFGSMGIWCLIYDDYVFYSGNSENGDFIITKITIKNGSTDYSLCGITTQMTKTEAEYILVEKGFHKLATGVFYDGRDQFIKIEQDTMYRPTETVSEEIELDTLRVNMSQCRLDMNPDKTETFQYMKCPISDVLHEIENLNVYTENQTVVAENEDVRFEGVQNGTDPLQAIINKIVIKGDDSAFCLYGITRKDSEIAMDYLSFGEGGSGEVIDPAGNVLYLWDHCGDEPAVSLSANR